MIRFLLILVGLAALAGCTEENSLLATPVQIEAVAYREPGPATMTVITMVNNRTGSGGHTSLMINGSQRIIFDPAGSFRHPTVPERGDVLYGITPGLLAGYKGAHARDSHHVVTQEIQVTHEQAEAAIELARRHGAVPGLFCTNSTTSILQQVPGFESIEMTYYPVRLMEQIERIQGVRTERYYENDAGDVTDGIKLSGG